MSDMTKTDPPTVRTARPVDGSSVRIELYTLPAPLDAPTWRTDAGKTSGDVIPGPHLRAFVRVVSDAGPETMTETVDLAVSSPLLSLNAVPDPSKVDLASALVAIHAAALSVLGYK